MFDRHFTIGRLGMFLCLTLFLSFIPAEAEKTQLAYYKVQTAPPPSSSSPANSPVKTGLSAPVPSNLQAPVQSMTLEQAFEAAIANNPGLQATRARLGVTEADIIGARLLPNPSLVSDNGIAEKTYRFGIEQTFQLGGKRKRRVALAQAQREVVLAEVNTAILDLRAELRRAYTRLFNAQNRLKTFEEVAATNERLVGVSQKRERAGDIPQLDVLQAEMEALRAQNKVRNAFNEVVQARTLFNMLLGQPLSNTWELAPPPGAVQTPQTPQRDTVLEPVPLQSTVNLQQIDLENLVQTALSSRPELQRGLRDIAVTESQLALARAERIPDLTIAAGPDLVFEEETQFNAFIVANMEIPVFNRQQGPILQAKARRTQLEMEQSALRNRTILEVTNAYTSFTLNQDQLRRYETELLPRAERIVEMSRRSFEVGKSNILIPLNAQQAYMETRLEYLQALLDYQNAISDLERAVGTGL